MPWHKTESGLKYWVPSPAEAAAMRRKHLEMVEALRLYEQYKQPNAVSQTLPGLDQQILSKLSAMHNALRAMKTQPISTRTGDPRRADDLVKLLDDYKQTLLSEHPAEAVAAEWMDFLCRMGGKAKIDAIQKAGLLRDSEIREAETPQGKSALQKRLDRATEKVEGYEQILRRFKEIKTAPVSDVKYGQMLDEGLGIQGNAAGCPGCNKRVSVGHGMHGEFCCDCCEPWGEYETEQDIRDWQMDRLEKRGPLRDECPRYRPR
jgi:hypothetical protein